VSASASLNLPLRHFFRCKHTKTDEARTGFDLGFGERCEASGQFSSPDVALCGEHPEIGAILLECSNLPPYAHAVQSITNRPVFDFLTMIDYVRAAGRRKAYRGNF
jgi:hypothetical protein